MTTNSSNGKRARVCRDRCEVCDVVIVSRPVANRRRCVDHVDQLALVPLAQVRGGKTRKGQ
jgi:hypothetical protein